MTSCPHLDGAPMGTQSANSQNKATAGSEVLTKVILPALLMFELDIA
jgi:hypothetical protein